MTKPEQSELTRYVQTELEHMADPAKAAPMQAYMKTDMPFYGVPKPLRAPIALELKKQFAPSTSDEYRKNVSHLWDLPHREEKY
ncbi:MAG: DNA alkylation repair protein, partial [Acidimicrobiia bacterium]